MSPGGHLTTTLLACAATAWATQSAPLTAGVFAGGFLIDVDHAVDYVVFERQRDLRPARFLRYYVDASFQRIVLLLHSYECFALVGALAWWSGSLAATGYLLGALMHLALDIVFNGELTPRSISAFYCFAYRASRGFRADDLFGAPTRLPVPPGFWALFFDARATGDALRRAVRMRETRGTWTEEVATD